MTPSEIAFLFGAGVGAAILLLVIAGSILGYLRAGRESIQRKHQKAVKADLSDLEKTEPATYDGGSLRADLEYLCSMVRRAPLADRWHHRLFNRGVTVRGCPGEDAHGQRYYLAEVAGTLLAHRDLDALIEGSEEEPGMLARTLNTDRKSVV